MLGRSPIWKVFWLWTGVLLSSLFYKKMTIYRVLNRETLDLWQGFCGGVQSPKDFSTWNLDKKDDLAEWSPGQWPPNGIHYEPIDLHTEVIIHRIFWVVHELLIIRPKCKSYATIHYNFTTGLQHLSVLFKYTIHLMQLPSWCLRKQQLLFNTHLELAQTKMP